MHQRLPTYSEPPTRRQRPTYFWRWFAFAAVVHVLAAFLGWVLGPKDRVEKPPVTYQPLRFPQSSAALAEARTQMRRQQQTNKPDAEKPKPEAEPTGQIVDIPPSADHQAPDHADYLAEHNARTEHETRSRHASPDHPTVAHEASAQSHAERSAPKPVLPQPQQQQAPREKSQSARADALKKGSMQDKAAQAAQDRLALHLDPSLGRFKNQEAQASIEAQQQQNLAPAPDQASQAGSDAQVPAGKGLTLADLMPNAEALARISGGPTNDALRDVDTGEGTFLNAREYKYAAFFNRVKHSVAQFWRPLGEYQRRDPTGNVYGYRSRMTTLEIVLDQEGNLSDVHLRQSSGVDFLDKEAIHAFEKAAPFPNPPKGLIGPSQTLHFEFGFLLDMQQRGFFQTPY